MKLYILYVIFLIWYLIKMLKIPFMSCGEKENHIWNILNCGGALQMLTFLLIRKEKLNKKLLIVFVGYSLHNTTYRFLIINSEVSEISKNTIMESSDVTFFENVFPLKNKLSKSICDISCSNLSSRSNANKDIIF